MTKPVTPLPCPVCGRRPKIIKHPYSQIRWRIECERNTATADHCVTADGNGESGAIKNWNRYVGRKK